MNWKGVGLAVLFMAGCATHAPPAQQTADPHYLTAKGCARKHCVALVLSGGGARGFAHVGVIKALEANGLKPVWRQLEMPVATIRFAG